MTKTKKEEKHIKDKKLKNKNKQTEEIKDTTIVKKEKVSKNENKKASFIERLGALVIDFFLISIIVSLITYPLSNSANYKKLNKEAENTIEQYSAGKINAKTYINRSADINYDLSRELGLSSLISIFVFSLYFIVFQFKNRGQTIGKKILKIKVTKIDDSELTINDIMFRSLIIDFILYDIIALCLTMFLNKDIYFYGVFVFELIQYVVIFISAIMILSRKDKRGIHDIITHTQVIKETTEGENV